MLMIDFLIIVSGYGLKTCIIKKYLFLLKIIQFKINIFKGMKKIFLITLVFFLISVIHYLAKILNMC